LSEAGRPQDSTPLAADDVIGSLATRVRELSLRVAQLEGELEAARKAIGVFEDFDAQMQDSLSAALRAANQIRERARVTAEALATEARSQQPANATELEAMRIERDVLRRVIDASSSSVPSRTTAPAPSIPMSEMRTAATEALRGVFKELVEEIRAANPPAQSVPPPAPVAARPVPAAPTPVYQAPPAPPVQPWPTPAPAVAAAPPAPAPMQSWSSPAPAPSRPYVAPPSTYNPPEGPPVVAPPQPRPAPRPSFVEDVEVAPAAAAPAPTPPAPQPAPAAAEPPREEWVSGTGEAIGEVQVVLSPISSFPRLVELERRLQGMPVVRTVYARDFRNGVATLAIGLRHPMTVDEFATAVTKLDYPRLRIVSTSGYVLELRIDAEASASA
jgi:F0F1-type ATP synthase membrane subunit b/b'